MCKVTDLVKLGPPLLQDLWIPYFTITTDITASTMRVHTDGKCAGSLLQRALNRDVRLKCHPLFLWFSSSFNLPFLLFPPPLLFAEHQPMAVHITGSRAVGKKLTETLNSLFREQMAPLAPFRSLKAFCEVQVS